MLKFRNLNVDPHAPVEEWGFEGLLAAVERGDIRDWHRLAQAVLQDPRGKVAAELEEVLDSVEDPAMSSLFSRILRRASLRADEDDRADVAKLMAQHLSQSRLTRTEFARQLGTSPSRLSTYLTGKVTPSAALLIRAGKIASR